MSTPEIPEVLPPGSAPEGIAKREAPPPSAPAIRIPHEIDLKLVRLGSVGNSSYRVRLWVYPVGNFARAVDPFCVADNAGPSVQAALDTMAGWLWETHKLLRDIPGDLLNYRGKLSREVIEDAINVIRPSMLEPGYR